MYYQGITDSVYQALASYGIGDYFDPTPYTDTNGVVFHIFIGDLGAWEDFLIDNELDEAGYGIGSFFMIKSTQGTGPV